VELNSSHPQAHFHLANAYFAKNWWEEALTEYEKVLDLKPDHGGAYFGLGGIFLNRGWVDRAIAAWEKFLTLEPASPKAQYVRDNLEAARNSKIKINKW
jgi:tetratricopeptide (TPR) repeat protein